MSADILHAGFDGLKVTVEAFISSKVREKLFAAKEEASATMRDASANVNGIDIAVRRSGGKNVSAHTGEYGAEMRLLDPDAQKGFEPGITIDFRAFKLATDGLEGAQRYFEQLMQALEVNYVDTQMRVARVDFAVDFLAPWFEPDPDALILPARTGKRAFMEEDTKESFYANTQVTGVTAGKVNNRQLIIYDKRAEVIAKRKPGWLTIWNHTRARENKPLVNLKDRDTSRVWRFEARMGSKCLRRRWEIRSWDDLDAMIGDAFAEFSGKIRYAIPQHDPNRSRWPNHELWDQVSKVYETNLGQYRSGVLPDTVRTVNREEHKRMLDRSIFGTILTRAAAEGVPEEGLEQYLKRYIPALFKDAETHPVSIETRLDKAAARYRFR